MLKSVSLHIALVLAILLAPIAPSTLSGIGEPSVAYAQTEQKAKPKAKAPKVKGVIYMSRQQCINACISRGPGRTEKTCSPWCGTGCRKAATGEDYCVQ